MEKRKKLAVLISGRGSNMEAILEATRDPAYPAEITLVISDNTDAQGLVTASRNEIETAAFPRSDYETKQDHEAAINTAIAEAHADLVVLAGYMRILSSDFVMQHEGRLLNIHPSLLPRFKGLDTHQRAIDAGDEKHGCTVHFVNSEMDGGAIIAQSELTVHAEDSADTLAKRVLKLEHKLYPAAISAWAKGDFWLEDGKMRANHELHKTAKGLLKIPA